GGGDHLARLHLRVAERDPDVRVLLGNVGELRARSLLERAERLDREPSVRNARQSEDRLAHVHVAGEARAAVDLAVRRPQLVELDGRMERDTLRGRSELL